VVAVQRLEGEALLEHPLSIALMKVVYQRGYEAAESEEICWRSGMSRAEFATQFGDKAEATLRVTEAYIQNLKGRLASQFATEPEWPDNLRAAAWEIVRWIRDYPEATWFVMVGMLGANEEALLRRAELFRWGAALIDGGREQAPDPKAVPAGASLLAIGAVVEVVRRQEEGSFDGEVVATVRRLMYSALRPYVGEEAARAELSVPPPPDFAAAEGGEGEA
jgi:AcrR family transcriptional regulator